MHRAVAIVPLTLAGIALTACGGGGGGGSSGGTSSGGGGTAPDGPRLVFRVATVAGAKPDAAVGDTSTYAVDGTLPALHSLALPLTPNVYRFAFNAAGLATLGASVHDRAQLQSVDATHVSFAQVDPIFDDHGVRTGENSYSGTAVAESYVAPGHVGFYVVTVTAVPHDGGSGIAVGDHGYLVVGPSGYASLARLDIGTSDNPQWLTRVGSTWYAQTSTWSASGSRVESEALTLNDAVTTGSYRVFHGATTDEEVAFSIGAQAVPNTGGHRGVLVKGTAPGYAGSTAYVAARYPTSGAAITAVIDHAAMTVTIGGGASAETFAIESFSYDPGIDAFTVLGLRDYVDASLSPTDKGVVEDVFLEFTPAGVLQAGQIGYSLAFDPTPDQSEDLVSDTPNDTLLGAVVLTP